MTLGLWDRFCWPPLLQAWQRLGLSPQVACVSFPAASFSAALDFPASLASCSIWVGKAHSMFQKR